MLYVKSEAGELIPITYEGVFAKCPGCGAVHQVDISEIMESCGGDVEDANVYCEECSKGTCPCGNGRMRLRRWLSDSLVSVWGRYRKSCAVVWIMAFPSRLRLWAHGWPMRCRPGKRSFSAWTMWRQHWAVPKKKPLPKWSGMGSRV